MLEDSRQLINKSAALLKLHEASLSGALVDLNECIGNTISSKSLVPMLQLIYSTWMTHLQVLESTGLLHEFIYIGLC